MRIPMRGTVRRAMQYALHATVLSPQSLADTVAADLKEAAEKYDKRKG